MNKPFFATLGIVAVAVFIAYRGNLALSAPLPDDMPHSARFVQTGFDVDDNVRLGNWVACRSAIDGEATAWCRVTDQQGTVLFEAQFLPIDSPEPVPASELSIGTLDPNRLWAPSPTGATPIPIIPLKDGHLLVPETDRFALRERWAETPDESKRFVHLSDDVASSAL